MQVTEMESVMDKLVEVGNNAPISVSQLAEGLNNASAILSVATENSFEKSVALLTSANTTIQNISKSSTALRTIVARIRKVDTELDELGEVMTSAQYDELTKALTDQNVALVDEQGELRNTYDVLRDLSVAWKDMTANERASLAQMFGSTRNQNVFTGLMENFQEASTAMDLMANSEGALSEANAIYLESIKAHTQQLKNAFDTMLYSEQTVDFMNQIVDFGKGLLGVLSNVVKFVDALGGLKTILIVISGLIIKAKFDKIKTSITGILTVFRNVPTVISSFTSGTALAVQGASKFQTALTALGGAANVANAALSAVGIVATAAFAIYTAIKNAEEERAAAAREAINSYDESADSVSEYKDRIQELKKSLDSGTLSEDEARSAREELIKIEEDLVTLLGNEASALSLVNGEYQDQSNIIDELAKKKWDSIYNEYIGDFTKAREAIENYNNEGLFDILVPDSGEIKTALEKAGIPKSEIESYVDSYYDSIQEEFDKAGIDFQLPDLINTEYWDIAHLDSANAYEVIDFYDQLSDIIKNVTEGFVGIGDISEEATKRSLEQYGKNIQDAKKVIEDNKSMFNTYAESMLLYNDKYSELYSNILTAQREFEQALLDNDEEAQRAALEHMEEARAAVADGWDNSALDLYMENFFKNWDEQTSNIEVKLNIKADIEENEIKRNKILSLLSEGGFIKEDGTIDIKLVEHISKLNGDIPEELKSTATAYNLLSWYAEQYGLETNNNAVAVAQLISLLEQLGYVSTSTDDVAQELHSFTDTLSRISKAVGSENVVEFIFRPKADMSLLQAAGWNVKDGDDINQLFTRTFANDEDTVAINFTPVILDEYGNAQSVLTPKELELYAKDVISGVREDDLKLMVGTKVEMDDGGAKAAAEDLANEINQLLSDFNIEYDGTKYEKLIKGLTAIDTATQRANKALEELNEALKEPDYNEGLDARIDNFEKFYELFESGDYGSQDYRAYARYFGFVDEKGNPLSPDEMGDRIKEYSKYVGVYWDSENEEWASDADYAMINFLEQLDKLEGKKVLIDDVSTEIGKLVSWDAELQRFSFDPELLFKPDELEKVAAEFGLTAENFVDLMNRVRYKSPDWVDFGDDDLISWLKDAELIKQDGDKVITFTDAIQDFLAATGAFDSSEIAQIMEQVRGLFGNEDIEVGLNIDTEATEEQAGQIVDQINSIVEQLGGDISDNIDIVSGLLTQIEKADLRQAVIDALDVGDDVKAQIEESISGTEIDIEATSDIVEEKVDEIKFLVNDGKNHEVGVEIKVSGDTEEVDKILNLAQNSVGENGDVSLAVDTESNRHAFIDSKYAPYLNEDTSYSNDFIITLEYDDSESKEKIIASVKDLANQISKELGVAASIEYKTNGVEVSEEISSLGDDYDVFATEVNGKTIVIAVEDKDVSDVNSELEGVSNLVIQIGDEDPITIQADSSKLKDPEAMLHDIVTMLDEQYGIELSDEEAQAVLTALGVEISKPKESKIVLDDDAARKDAEDFKGDIEENPLEVPVKFVPVYAGEGDLESPENAEATGYMQGTIDYVGDQTTEDLSGYLSGGATVDAHLNNPDELASEAETAVEEATPVVEPEIVLPSDWNNDNYEIINFKVEEVDTTQQEQAFVSLEDYAKECGVSVDELCDELGIANNTNLDTSESQANANDLSHAVNGTENAIEGFTGMVGEANNNQIESSGKVASLDYIANAALNAANQLSQVIRNAQTLNNTSIKIPSSDNITAAANGTKHAKAGVTLLGDEYNSAGQPRPELVVSDGEAYIAGINGPTFANLKAGDVVYPYDETKKILKNSKAGGNLSGVFPAFKGGGSVDVNGIKNSWSSGAGNTYVDNSTTNYNYNSDSGSSSAEEEFEWVDWIEIKLSRIERIINRLKKVAESTYKTLKQRITATNKEITKVTTEIATQEKAYARYIKQANSVNLSSSLKKRVRNGTIDINQYNEATRELISEYQEWYEKALACSDAIQELHENLAALYEDNFNNIQQEYENRLTLLEHFTNSYNTAMDQAEAKGYLISKNYYSALSDIEKRNIKVMEEELSQLEQSFATAVNSGEIEKYSESWYSMYENINSVKEAIDESNLSLIEYQKSMRELDWSYFDYIQERISQITQEANFLIDLMSESDLFEDSGQFSDTGEATMGLHIQNLDVYMAQADDYAEEMLKISKDLAEDPYNTDLIKRREELLKLQQESILAAENEKKAVKSLVEEGINIELANLKELIDTYNNGLDSAKNLYDYQKKVAQQTQNIAKLEKQMAALSNNTSEETKAKVQKIKVDLESAREELEETEYDKFISDSKKMLDDLYNDYEEILNLRLDDVNALLSDLIEDVNDRSDEINTTIHGVSEEVGYNLTDSMNSIWAADGAATSIVASYGDDFSSKLTSINEVLSGISGYVHDMVRKSDDQANTEATSILNSDTATATNATKVETPVATTPTTTNTNKVTTTANKATTAKLTDAVKKKVAAAIWWGTLGWGVNPDRSKKLTEVFGKNNGIQALVNKYVGYNDTSADVKNYSYLKMRKKFKGYKTGGLNDYTGLAMLHGTPQKPEAILNAQDTKNFMELKDVLSDLSSPLRTLNNSNVTKSIKGVTSGSSINTINGGINISLPNVRDYEDFANQLRQDKNFEKMIQSMTVDRLAGRNSLAKYNYKW